MTKQKLYINNLLFNVILITWSRSVSVSRSARLYSSLNPWALVSTVTEDTGDLMTRGSALM